MKPIRQVIDYVFSYMRIADVKRYCNVDTQTARNWKYGGTPNPTPASQDKLRELEKELREAE